GERRQEVSWDVESQARSRPSARHAAHLATRARNPWAVEPDVDRVAHGLPNRVDRVVALGNTVVPEITEAIGRAILKAERQLYVSPRTQSGHERTQGGYDAASSEGEKK